MDTSGIIGNYIVERELGRGGMGVVYAAKHRVLGRPAAIKLLLANEPERIQRFFNEARAAMAIDHPGIVKIYDVGVAADGRAFIAMELLAGQTLHAQLSRGPLPLRFAIEHARKIAAALAAAHAAGVIHRDLKPDNIFIDRENQLKLVDFGIAKLAQPLDVRTATGALIGTPAYMSPEQCEGLRELDARTDLYSLGCVLYAMLTGRPPFETGGTGGIIASQLHTPPPPLRSRCPSASPALEQVVHCLLAKSRDDRFRDASAALAALGNPALEVIEGAVAAGRGISVALTADAPPISQSYPTAASVMPVHVSVPPPATPPVSVDTTPAPLATPPVYTTPAPTLAPPEKRRTGLVIALLLAGCGATAAVTLVATRGCGGTQPAIVATADTDAQVTAPKPLADRAEQDAQGSGAVDLAVLRDAAPPPPVDAAGSAKKPKPDQPRLSGSGSRVADVRKEPTKELPKDDPPKVEAPPDAPPEPVREPPKPPPPPSIDQRLAFDPDSFSMPNGYDNMLDQIARIAGEHPGLRFVITGNAESGETKNPGTLALARANTVMMRLIMRHLSRDRFTLSSDVGSGRDVRITTR